jgi:DNA-binding protein YbaB
MPQLTLEHLQKYSKTYAFIESGTYLGDTVKTAVEYGFESVHSIEIEPNLHKDAVEKFNEIIASKVSDALEARKQEVATSIGIEKEHEEV